MTTTPIAAGPLDVTVRALFEQWYLRVVKGHPNNLTRDENGGYKFIGTLYLAFEAATMIEREACAKVCEKMADERFADYGTREHDTGATYYSGRAAEEYEARDEEDNNCAAAIRARSNDQGNGPRQAQLAEGPR